MNLVVDQGNTQFKLGIFEGSELLKTYRLSYENFEEAKIKLSKFPIDQIIISSVVGKFLNFDFIDANTIQFNHKTNLPIGNNYLTPETLGLDRIANAVAAWTLNKNGNSLVIDLGTCIKYDLVAKTGVYLGGNISLGLQMRFNALEKFTAQLPLLRIDKGFKQLNGNDTESSMQCGVQNGIQYEIKGFIERYRKEFNQLTIFMTGGDLKHFDKTDKKSIFAQQNLTLIGLNEILKHNA